MGGKSSSSSSSTTHNETYTSSNTANAGNLATSFNFSNILGAPTLNFGEISNTNTSQQETRSDVKTETKQDTTNTSNTESSSSAKAGGALEGVGSGLGLGIGGGMGAGGMVSGDTIPYQYQSSGSGSNGSNGFWSANTNNGVLSGGIGVSSNVIMIFGGLMVLVLVLGKDEKRKKEKKD